MNKGFTLVEIVVVLAIMSVVGLMLTQIFFNTIKGSSKAQVLSAIKQNGQAAVEGMDKTIRNADKIVEICSGGSGVVVFRGETTNPYTRFMFVAEVTTGTVKNGYIYQESSNSLIACTDLESSSSLRLTDTNTKTGVSIVSGGSIFSVNPLPGTGNLVTIHFQVKPGVDIQSIYSDIDPVPFKTTIGLRSQ